MKYLEFKAVAIGQEFFDKDEGDILIKKSVDSAAFKAHPNVILQFNGNMEMLVEEPSEALRLIRSAGENFTNWSTWAHKWPKPPDDAPKEPEPPIKHMTEVALDVFIAAYPAPLTISSVEKLSRLAGADMDSRNCGGYWDIIFIHAGLIEPNGHTNVETTWRLSENGYNLLTQKQRRDQA